MKLHTVSQASKLAQVSAGTVRSLTGGKYANAYAGLWSDDATPGPGGTRLLRDSDIAMLRYIRSQTERGRSHEAIAADIRAGALVDVLPEEEPQEPESSPPDPTPGGEPDPAQGGAMVLYSWGRLLQAQLAAAQERETDITERLIDAERRAAAAESRAQALADQLAERRRSWWDRLRNR